MTKLTFHVVALPHTTTSKLHNACAYTQKVLNFCKMMHSLGHTVYHYGAEGSEVDCTEHINIISTKEQEQYFGGHNWRKLMYNLKWDINEPYWKICNLRASAEILRRRSKTDFLCLIAGLCQAPICEAIPDIMPVEFGIGYTGVFAPYRIYESYAHMNYIYGFKDAELHNNGRFYDVVIPNYYDVDDFPFQANKQDYYLYIGRLISRKGLIVASQVVESVGGKLILAGQGAKSWNPEKNILITEENQTIEGSHIEYIGYADTKKRAELMGAAKAVLVPTLYLEPFGGVNVEAQLCGTPVITTDWGAFPETVEHGVSGYRCRTHEQFCWAANNVQNLDYLKIRERAISLYSLEKVRTMYDEYFHMLYDIFFEGYYQKKPRNDNLDWLKRT